MSAEIPLDGGNTNAGVVRVGDTVRRAPRPNARALRALLEHLDARAPGIAPRHLGTDERGREVLSWIEGWSGVDPALWREEAPLVGAARLLRRLHDACADFDTSAWEWPMRRTGDADGVESTDDTVLCHHDAAPYNMVFRDGAPVALIDFDLAGPGPALHDVAYTLYWFAPLAFAAEDMRPFAERELAAGLPRTRLFCETYGIGRDAALVDAVAERLRELADVALMRRLFGEAVAARLVDEGHVAHWARESRAFEARRDRLVRAFGETP